jgi:alanine racemase
MSNFLDSGPKAYIHVDRLQTNFLEIQKQTKMCTIMAIVKTNAYGHGAELVAQSLSKVGCEWFGVFTHQEGIDLRRGGINKNIFILCKISEAAIHAAVHHDFTLNLSGWEDFTHLESYYQNYKKLPKVHLKIDTGMTRLGFKLDESEAVLDKIKSFEPLICNGIYTHFSTADEGNLDYTYSQIKRFQFVINQAENSGHSFQYKHCANSGGVLNIPDLDFNMVRVGLLMYGAYPSDQVSKSISVKPVMNFKGTVVELRKIKSGIPVSYGGIWTSTSDTQIGVVQAGFADGVPRPWNENGMVGLRGKQFPIAGRICMDQLMVDFGNEPIEIGDEVLFWGKEDEHEITVEDISEKIGLTPYVLFTNLSHRVKRIPIFTK